MVGSLAACGGLDISIWPIRKPWGKRKGRDEAGPEDQPRKKFAACAGFACIPSLAEDAAAIAAATAAAKAQHALPGTASRFLFLLCISSQEGSEGHASILIRNQILSGEYIILNTAAFALLLVVAHHCASGCWSGDLECWKCCNHRRNL